MEFEFTYTKSEQRKQYIYGYYNRPVLWFQRKVLGPLIIILAVFLILISPSSTNIIISIFFILFGLYYTTRPFLMLLRIKFDGTKLHFIFEGNDIRIENESGTLKFTRKDISQIKRKTNYLFIQIQLNYKQYYIINLNKENNNKGEEFVQEISKRFQ